jgi:hypothetical protein
MADLARCNNIECIKHNDCYRFNEELYKQQDFNFNFKCICEQNNFTYFSPLEKKTEHQ